jgi:2-methylcitrate dehydratase
VQACREQVAEFGGSGPCSLTGDGQANPIYAAFWHTALVRYVDFMDNFLAPKETCHTADNFGVALTITDYVGGSGRDLMLGVALGYTVQSRFVDHANFMSSGFDHTSQLAFSHNAAAGRLLGWASGRSRTPSLWLRSAIRPSHRSREPLSQWRDSPRHSRRSADERCSSHDEVEVLRSRATGHSTISENEDQRDWDKQSTGRRREHH